MSIDPSAVGSSNPIGEVALEPASPVPNDNPSVTDLMRRAYDTTLGGTALEDAIDLHRPDHPACNRDQFGRGVCQMMVDLLNDGTVNMTDRTRDFLARQGLAFMQASPESDEQGLSEIFRNNMIFGTPADPNPMDVPTAEATGSSRDQAEQ